VRHEAKRNEHEECGEKRSELIKKKNKHKLMKKKLFTETEKHTIRPLWYNGENTWNWTDEDFRKAMANELSEKQKNHIKKQKS
jgi:hypothetical protein